MGYGSMAFKAVVEWSKGKNLYLNSADGKGRKYFRTDKDRLDTLVFQRPCTVDRASPNTCGKIIS